MFTIEVCFTPGLFEFRQTKGDAIIVIADILRATSAICAAFDAGVEAVLPVEDIEQAKMMKDNGFLVAAERDGMKPDFADFGNSPAEFVPGKVRGKTIVYSTTNGTRAIAAAVKTGRVLIGSFLNLSALARWIISSKKNVVILCAGWKGSFSLEDALFAGALSEKLSESGLYCSDGDSASASLDLWKLAKADLVNYISKASHRRRLIELGLDSDLEMIFNIDSMQVVPILQGDKIVKLF